MPIEFYLNRETAPRRAEAAGDMTVLQFLRGAGLCGTKEGCASGDCGACTAVIAEAADGHLRCCTINTCITFMSALHHRLLITVEGLADDDGALHPAQAAMVSEHASQCGFCTPGFVMSLFALYQQPPAAAEAKTVSAAIAGNLCRCTGYLPIIRAGQRMLESPPASDFYQCHESQLAARLSALAAAGGAPASSPQIAQTTEQLAEMRRRDSSARIFAGGTDLALQVTVEDDTLPALIDISRLAQHRRIEETDTHWTLGAAVTVQDCMRFFAERLPALIPYLERFGSPPIRARATVGGNIGNASPIADLPPPLLALDAEITLTDGETARRLPLAGFYLGYKKTALAAGEWIEAVHIPRPAPGALFKVFKISKRIEDDISAVAGAFCWQFDGDKTRTARLAFGGMAAAPKRAAAAEARFVNQPWSADAIAAAADALAEDFTPLSDARAGSDYRLQAAAAMLTRAYMETAADAPPRIESL